MGGPVRAREALAGLLETEPGIDVVGVASTLQELPRPFIAPPDLALVDVRLPDVRAILGCRDFRQRFPTSRVLLYSTYADAGTVAAIAASGASGHAQKTLDTAALVRTLKDAAQGRFDLAAREAAAGVVRWVESGLVADPNRSVSPLERHLDLLRLLATGHADREIGDRLNLDPTTTSARVAQLYLELHQNRAFRSSGASLARHLG